MKHMSNGLPRAIGPEEIAYQGKMIEVVHQRMQEGAKERTYEWARRAPGVRLIILQGEGILLSREYRPALQGWDLRLPGGKVFDSLVEYNDFIASRKDILSAAAAAARKEALEEVGMEAGEVEHFTTSPCGAMMEWDLFYFIVKNPVPAHRMPEQGEHIEPVWISLAEAEAACLKGEIREGRSAAALLQYFYSRKTTGTG